MKLGLNSREAAILDIINFLKNEKVKDIYLILIEIQIILVLMRKSIVRIY